jgi:hypothetical protein
MQQSSGWDIADACGFSVDLVETVVAVSRRKVLKRVGPKSSIVEMKRYSVVGCKLRGWLFF